jgi:hypothetical protein
MFKKTLKKVKTPEKWKMIMQRRVERMLKRIRAIHKAT